jgi:parallel beta-helix repeat protein
MPEVARITVGQTNADFLGSDNRALQAAVDYIANLGGGTIEIGPGEYLMRDSLHLRPHVTVRGSPGRTVLRKADGVEAPLAIDGDFGEEQMTVVDPKGFEVGCGVAIWSKRVNGFHITVTRITGRNGSTFAIDRPLNADCMVSDGARAATIFPVVSGYELEGVRLEDLIIEGNRANNAVLDGCRGGGIFLYRGFGTVIERCTVRDFNGDGISFQQSNDVILNECVSENNAVLGLHPGSGSQRATVRRCTARNNGADGLFLCWRVRHGLFEENVLEDNGRYGISIGHKDTDNLLRKNRVRNNGQDGVCFRDESLGMAGHRNRVEDNLIENNGRDAPAAGIRVRGETRDVQLKSNQIRDTRPIGSRRQNTGIQLEERVGPVKLDANEIEAEVPVRDQRRPAPSTPK